MQPARARPPSLPGSVHRLRRRHASLAPGHPSVRWVPSWPASRSVKGDLRDYDALPIPLRSPPPRRGGPRPPRRDRSGPGLLRDRRPSIGPTAVDRPPPLGVLVVSMPVLNSRLRPLAWPSRYRTGDRRADARRINRELRTLSRVIVDPRVRGIGLATRLTTLPRCPPHAGDRRDRRDESAAPSSRPRE